MGHHVEKPEELAELLKMKPVQIKVSARDFMQLHDAINNPSEPNDALRKAVQRYHESKSIPCYLPITRESMRQVLGDPMQGVSYPMRALTPEERMAEEKATHDYLTEHLGDQFQGVSFIVPENKLEEELRKHV